MVIVLALAFVAAFFGVQTADETTSSTTTTASSTPTSTPSSAPVTGDAELPRPTPGDVIVGETPCPATDGSSPRVTTFSAPPPSCIDPSMQYTAILHTSEGDITLLLNAEQSFDAVNNFVVLSRYHYYDGQAFTSIVSRESAGVKPRFDNPPDRESPGYVLPGDPEPTIWTTGQIGMVPNGPGTTQFSDAFLLATFELAPGLPTEITQFGIMLDGAPVLQALERVSSQTGSPTDVVVINSITILEEPAPA